VTVYVDPVRYYDRSMIGSARARRAGNYWCHMMADSLEELHALAGKLQLRRDWFQNGKYPHYDLTANKREAALRLGAIPIAAREWIRRQQLV